MKKLVVLSGAGVSAESGIKTFRDSGGLWEGYDVMAVASPEGWAQNAELVLDFYNQRRKNAISAVPNEGHQIIAELESYFNVSVITQNIDNLHEQAGSSNVIHLHGELFKSRSTADPSLIYDIEGCELNMGDTCEKGAQLRPHIVWFGEMVPMMDVAVEEVITADIFIVIGTSLQVYPAAGLLEYARGSTPIYVIDPNMPDISYRSNLHLIEEVGSIGMKLVKQELINDHF
jgi:NAD-dependent deacetylase